LTFRKTGSCLPGAKSGADAGGAALRNRGNAVKVARESCATKQAANIWPAMLPFLQQGVSALQ